MYYVHASLVYATINCLTLLQIKVVALELNTITVKGGAIFFPFQKFDTSYHSMV